MGGTLITHPDGTFYDYLICYHATIPALGSAVGLK